MPAQLPFLTWAGGKRWLTRQYSSLFPQQFKTYYEPFLGSGAVFFHLSPEKSVLSDLNCDLINTYIQIKERPDIVLNRLTEHHNQHSTEYYYHIRKQIYPDAVDRAAQFIYLNRTCWNGLYRVNRSGQFNVPIGTKTNIVLASDNFYNTALALEKSILKCEDFSHIDTVISPGDFIYYDPPYTVQHNNNGFIEYNKKLFSWSDQERLHSSAIKAKNSGAFVAISNAYHPSIVCLYSKEFNIHILHKYASISGRKNGRKKTEEILITSY